MAIAMAVVAMAGMLMAIRTTFDPPSGPSRLIFAFEAVIIGGMGSPWGTLIGGIILGVTQAIGFASRRHRPAVRSCGLPAGADRRPQGLFPRMRG